MARSSSAMSSKAYGYGPFATPVVEDCSFTVEPNKFTVMIGPSGVRQEHADPPHRRIREAHAR